MVWRCCGFVAGIGLLAASPGLAGTRGGLYDMKALLNEAHPFAASAQRPAPVAMPPARAMPALAPPPPTLRYTPPPPPPSTLPATRLPGPKVSPPSTAGPPAIAPPSPRLAQTRQKGKLLPSPRVAPGGSAPPPRLAAATAEPAPDGWFDRIYLSAGGGAHFPDDIGGNTPAGATYSADMETGFLLRAAAGARVAEMLRAEVEIAYRA
ncbi:MAG: hypothetical protein QF491_00720, partial [Alphaproteobacteria bacterium]|nr:hypothetical protein [Alphaproteobacteria bacterium]